MNQQYNIYSGYKARYNILSFSTKRKKVDYIGNENDLIITSTIGSNVHTLNIISTILRNNLIPKSIGKCIRGELIQKLQNVHHLGLSDSVKHFPVLANS